MPKTKQSKIEPRVPPKSFPAHHIQRPVVLVPACNKLLHATRQRDSWQATKQEINLVSLTEKNQFLPPLLKLRAKGCLEIEAWNGNHGR